MKVISGGVCAPKGFLAGGIRCGIKPSSKKKDLALIYSNKVCSAAAMFTTNKVKAASIQVSMENIKDGRLQAVIINSGNANACTGDDGLNVSKKMVNLAADALLINPCDVIVASTGVIGVPLPVEVIEENIGVLKSSLTNETKGHDDALEAIMTTDIRKKEITVEIEIDSKIVRIGAMTKGSGMINPNMADVKHATHVKHATMLAFITTDAAIMPSALDICLKKAVKKSFNRLTVDGDTSTNDMVLVMANGEAGNKPIVLTESGQLSVDNLSSAEKDYKTFYEALEYVCTELTKMMARDGEGATKLVTVTVDGAESEETAEKLAKSVVSSSLVKAACFGADANWGRVLCAMGYAGAEFSAQNVNVSFKSSAGDVMVCKDGKTYPFSEEKAKQILNEEEIEIYITLSDGQSKVSVWGCDLTYDYVKINGDYRS